MSDGVPTRALVDYAIHAPAGVPPERRAPRYTVADLEPVRPVWIDDVPPRHPNRTTVTKARRRPVRAAFPNVEAARAEVDRMFDSLTIARQLTEAGIERAQADVLADAIRQAAEHGEHVTPETLRAEVATLHGAISSLRADIFRAMLLQAGVIVGAVVAILRLLG